MQSEAKHLARLSHGLARQLKRRSSASKVLRFALDDTPRAASASTDAEPPLRPAERTSAKHGGEVVGDFHGRNTTSVRRCGSPAQAVMRSEAKHLVRSAHGSCSATEASFQSEQGPSLRSGRHDGGGVGSRPMREPPLRGRRGPVRSTEVRSPATHTAGVRTSVRRCGSPAQAVMQSEAKHLARLPHGSCSANEASFQSGQGPSLRSGRHDGGGVGCRPMRKPPLRRAERTSAKHGGEVAGDYPAFATSSPACGIPSANSRGVYLRSQYLSSVSRSSMYW